VIAGSSGKRRNVGRILRCAAYADGRPCSRGIFEVLFAFGGGGDVGVVGGEGEEFVALRLMELALAGIDLRKVVA
jgi:hypothetical protein